MYTKLDDRPKEKKETTRQEICQCTCLSETETPGGTIVAKNYSTNQIRVDVAVNGREGM